MHARATSRGVTALAVTGVVATLLWVGTGLLMAGRGFTGPNEGYYLLSYRYWDSTPRTFSLTQYLLGPLFQLLDYNVRALRIVRVLTLLGCHLFLGAQVAAWIAWKHGGRWVHRRNRIAIASAIAGCAGITFGWLPATPGYNDLALVGGTVGMASVLLVMRRDGWVPAAAVGAACSVMVLARPTAALCAAVLVGVVVMTASEHRWRRIAAVIAGSALIVAAIHVFVRPIGDILPPYLDTLRVVGDSKRHQPLELLASYLTTSLRAMFLGAVAFLIPGVAAAALVRMIASCHERGPQFAGAVGALVMLALVGLFGGLQGGLQHVGAYQSGAVALVLGAIGGWAVSPPRQHRDTAVVALLLATPVLAAVGTDNPILSLAVNGAGCWLGAMMLLALNMPRNSPTTRAWVFAMVPALVVLCASVGVTGALHSPQGPALYRADARVVPAVPLLSTLRLPRADADEAEDLRTALAPWIEPGGRRMIAFGELSDQVLILEGRPVGNAWFSDPEDGIQSADLRDACQHGNPWGLRQPLVLLKRHPTPGELAGFTACGLDLGRDYESAQGLPAGLGYRVLVPRLPVSSGTPS